MNGNVIAKNTLYLYFRMMLVLLVSLYTSRVVLQVLGLVDYGLYQTVAGFIAFLSFINNALAAGSSRCLTFAIGKGNNEEIKATFSSVLIIHILLGLLIILVSETIGLWFVFNKLNIPPDRFNATVFVYHISVIMSFFSVTQVPYNAVVISHEKMSISAYVGIVNALLKLLIVYALQISSFDKLKIYAILLCAVQICEILFYRIYCMKNFFECRCMLLFNKAIVKNIIEYTSWNVLTNVASALVLHGTTVLTNMFFNPGVVAARAIANQVNAIVNQFVGNFRLASTPQIIKRYAVEDYDGSKRLLIRSTVISYFLMLLFCLPLFFSANMVLKLWLGSVPEYAPSFLRLTIVTSLFLCIGVSFFVPLSAKGRLKENAIGVTVGHFLTIGLVYILFKNGCSPLVLAWMLLFEEFFLSILLKSYILVKIVGYKWLEIKMVLYPCLKVSFLSLLVPLGIFFLMKYFLINEYISFFVITPVSIVSVVIVAWFWGMDAVVKDYIRQIIVNKMKIFNFKC